MFPEAMSSPTPSAEIQVNELAQRLQSARPPTVVEVLGPQYFAGGHLPGALNLPLAGFNESAPRLLPDKAAEVVVYCASSGCQNSDIAARQLHTLGYSNIRVFKGGKAAWRDAGYPLLTA